VASTISGIGFRPVRGNWEFVALPVASAATFQQWAPVDFDGNRNLIEATSASTAIVGVATSYSTSSTSIGGYNSVLIAIPADNTAVARTSILSTVVASALSWGQAYNINKLYNNLGVDVSSQASAVVVLRGSFDSATSTIDVQFLGVRVGIPSFSSISVF
jgi:hypothetical protein